MHTVLGIKMPFLILSWLQYPGQRCNMWKYVGSATPNRGYILLDFAFFVVRCRTIFWQKKTDFYLLDKKYSDLYFIFDVQSWKILKKYERLKWVEDEKIEML